MAILGFVPTHCTCGALLPPDARFCHKCGKPQVEFQPEPDEPTEQEFAAQPVQPPPPPDISFHNPIAVRTGLVTGIGGALIGTLPIPIPPMGVWLLIVLLLAGFLAVYLYQRRTGQSLSIVAGARMGWITGLFSFVVSTVLFTITVLLIVNDSQFAALIREQLQSHVATADADMERVIDALSTPAGLAPIVIPTLATFFVLFTIFPTLGGALGAKVLERNRA